MKIKIMFILMLTGMLSVSTISPSLAYAEASEVSDMQSDDISIIDDDILNSEKDIAVEDDTSLVTEEGIAAEDESYSDAENKEEVTEEGIAAEDESYPDAEIMEEISEEEVVGASIESGIYNMYVTLSGRNCYASVASGTTSVGGNIQTTALSDSNALRFEVSPVGSYYKIINTKSGLVLTDSAGNTVQTTWSSDTSQQWSAIKSGNAVRWKNRKTGRYLNVEGGSSKYTTNIDTISLSDIVSTAQINWYIVSTGINVASCGISVPDQEYTGKAVIPEPTVFYNGEQLVQGADYTVSCSNNIKRGTASLTINGIGRYTGSKTVTFRITTLISKATMTGVGSAYRYTGSAIKPTPKMTLNGTSLVAGTDYTVSYTNNINAGTGRVIVTGKGNYGGTAYKDFFIIKCANSITNNGTYYIVTHDNPSSSLAVDGMKNNSHVLLAARRVTELQKFQLIKNSDGTYKIYSARSGLVVASAQNKKVAGNMAVLYENTGKAAQNWKIVKNSDNSFSFQNPTLGLSLGTNTPGGYAYTGAGTILRMCATQDITSQKFWLVKCADISKPMEGTYTIGSGKTNFVLQTTNSSKDNNANTVLMTKSGSLSQTYKIIYSGSGYYRIINANSGKVLGMNGDSTTSGANVRQETWTASRDQRWKLTQNSDGTYKIANMDGIVLSASSKNLANGRNVNAKKESASNVQIQSWMLEKQ